MSMNMVLDKVCNRRWEITQAEIRPLVNTTMVMVTMVMVKTRLQDVKDRTGLQADGINIETR